MQCLVFLSASDLEKVFNVFILAKEYQCYKWKWKRLKDFRHF